MAITTDAFYEVLLLMGKKAGREGDGGDGVIGEAIGTPATDTGEVQVPVMMVVLTTAEAVFALSHTIVQFVQ